MSSSESTDVSSDDESEEEEEAHGTTESAESTDDEGPGIKGRLKGLFGKKKEEENESAPEVLGAPEDRIDPGLLEATQEYDAVPMDTAAYGKVTYWDERYSKEIEPFEWYQSWNNLAPSLLQYVDEMDAVLMCGCGSSTMTLDMFDDGIQNIISVDSSRVATETQLARTQDDYPSLEWRAMDLTLTDFKDGQFDVAIDKACLDALLCRLDGGIGARKYLQEMDRILAPDGAFICITYSKPEARLPLLEVFDLDKPDEALSWDVHVDAIAKPTHKKWHFPNLNDPNEVYFIYVCIKDPEKAFRKQFAKEKSKREHMARINKLLGRGRGRGRGRGGR
ncbi:unnamed protein product [Chrysoparadoxa australica]